MVGTVAVGKATAGEPTARQDEPAAGAARVDLQKAADVQALAILEFLSKSRAKVWSGYRGDPEQRKLLEKVHIAIRWLQELDGRDALTEAQRGMGARLLAANPVMYGVDPLIALMDDWDRLLIETGDETYVRTLLAAELVRSSSRTSVVVWSRLFGHDQPFWRPAILSGQRLEPDEIARAKNQLLELYRTRTIDYELARARIHMTSRLLWWLSPFLAILVGGLMIALTSRESVWIASFAGALGALVSGALRVRDQVKQINALRAFWPVVVVQPLLGAAAGLFLYLIANVGVKGVLSADLLSSENAWALYGVLGFVAGFSEPIFLGVIDKFAELVDPKEGSSPPAAGGPPA